MDMAQGSPGVVYDHARHRDMPIRGGPISYRFSAASSNSLSLV